MFVDEHEQNLQCGHGWTPLHKLSWRLRESGGTPRNLRPSPQGHRWGQARGCRRWSFPREEDVQSRTLVARESCLNDWTVDSWRRSTPSPSAGVQLNRSGGASNERAQIFSCRCHRVVPSGHFAMVLSHQLCVGCGECFARVSATLQVFSAEWFLMAPLVDWEILERLMMYRLFLE